MSLESLFSVLRVSDSDDSEMDCAGDAVLVFEVELGHEQALVGASKSWVGGGVCQILFGGGIKEVLDHESLNDLVLLLKIRNPSHESVTFPLRRPQFSQFTGRVWPLFFLDLPLFLL
jgi:hypothetical protein